MKILTALLLAALLTGCGQAYSTSGARPQLDVKVQQAMQNVRSNDSRWTEGITNIVQTNNPPPSGVNYAGVNCPGEVVFFNTTLESSVEHLEALLIHEAWEIRHGCNDYDVASGEVVACYREGRSYDYCEAKVEREFY